LEDMAQYFMTTMATVTLRSDRHHLVIFIRFHFTLLINIPRKCLLGCYPIDLPTEGAHKVGGHPSAWRTICQCVDTYNNIYIQQSIVIRYVYSSKKKSVISAEKNDVFMTKSENLKNEMKFMFY